MAKSGSLIKNGALPRDGNHIAIQAGQKFVTQDVTGTPQTSPIAYSTTIIAIVVPDNAIKMTLIPSTDLRVSDLATFTTANYDLLKANIKETIDVAGMQTIYVVRDSADGNLFFKFVTI